MIDQIKLLIKKKVLPVKPYFTTDNNYINDIKDGSLYEEFVKKNSLERGVLIHSFMINTDGISCCDKSTLSIWPVYLAINEIEVQSRFDIDNIILAGLCVGLTKPSIADFFIPIKKELLDLSLGIRYDEKT